MTNRASRDCGTGRWRAAEDQGSSTLSDDRTLPLRPPIAVAAHGACMAASLLARRFHVRPLTVVLSTWRKPSAVSATRANDLENRADQSRC